MNVDYNGILVCELNYLYLDLKKTGVHVFNFIALTQKSIIWKKLFLYIQKKIYKVKIKWMVDWPWPVYSTPHLTCFLCTS